MTLVHIKMKRTILLAFCVSMATILQTTAWKAEYPTTSVDLGFTRRLQRSLIGKLPINRRLQTFLTPVKGIQRPHVKQRTIRDLMNNFMGKNHRIQMGPAPPFNRQVAQRGQMNPSMSQNVRGSNSQTRYRQALALPSSPAIHSLENSRPQPMIRHEQMFQNPNLRSVHRPRPMHQQSPLRPPSLRNQPNAASALKDLSMSRPSAMHSLRQPDTDSFESAIADILSAPSNNQQRNRKAPNRVVEVVHHIPVAMNPSKMKANNPAVVYISKPKNNMQSPQSMFMRDVRLPSSETKLTQEHPFITRDQSSIFSKGSDLMQDVSLLNSEFQDPRLGNPKPQQQNMKNSHLMPGTNIQGQFVRDSFEENRNSEVAKTLQNLPPSQGLRQIPSRPNIKYGIASSLSRPTKPPQDKIPRINRLKQELNDEIRQLLKLVPQSPTIPSTKPKIVMKQQIPRPFLMPSSEFEETFGANSGNQNSPDTQIHASKYRPVVRQPHFPVPENMKEQFLKVQTLKRPRLPPVPERLPLNHRRPVVSESSVDSEELTEILKSMGYNGDKKLIHNAASVKPVKLIIPPEGKNKQPIIISSPSKPDEFSHTYKEASRLLQHESPLTYENTENQKEKSIPSQNSEASSSDNKDLSSSQSQHLSPYRNAEAENQHTTNNEDTPYIPDNEGLPSDHNNKDVPPPHKHETSLSSHDNENHNKDPSFYNEESLPSSNNNEGLPFRNTAGLQFPLNYEESQLSHPNEGLFNSQTKKLIPAEPEDRLPLTNLPANTRYNVHPNNKTVSQSKNKEPIRSTNTQPLNKSSIKTYWDFRKLNGRLQTTPSPPQAEASSKKTREKEKEPSTGHNVSNYQGEESIASISVKEEFPVEEKVKKKYNKFENSQVNSGTLHDIYNKRILDDRNRDEPSSHAVRYYPQHLPPDAIDIITTPNFNKESVPPTRTTEIRELDNLNKNPGHTDASQKRVPNFVKPKERTRGIFPALNIRERPTPLRTTTVAPRYSTMNRNINISPAQRQTPGYIITKSPFRQPYGQRSKPQNENSLVNKYVVPGRQQFRRVTAAPAIFPAEPLDYVTPQPFFQHSTSPRPTNFRFKPYATETPAQFSSYSNSNDTRASELETVKENSFKDGDSNKFSSLTTTGTPEEVTRISSEMVTSESQVENTHEIENDAHKFPPTPETVTIHNKQFFRGPQHSLVLDDLITDSYNKYTTTFRPSSSLEVKTHATTEIPQFNRFMPHNETMNTQTKVINALQLANKVFGRRNNTSIEQPLITTRAPHVRHKFTYAPISKPLTSYPEVVTELPNTENRIVFNFKTGTTQNLPIRSSSVAPRVIYNPGDRSKPPSKSINDSLDFIPRLKEENKIIISPKNSSKTSLFQHVVFSQANISSKSSNNESITESSKDLYGILKPITKPYNSSTEDFDEKELKKLTTKAITTRLSSTTVKSIIPQSPSTPKDLEAEISKQMILSSSTSVPRISQTDMYKDARNQSILPTTTEVGSNISVRNSSENIAEKSMPYTTTKDLQTEVPNSTISESLKELTTEFIDHEQLVVDSLKSMQLKMQDVASKGLRHLMPLVMELSSDVSISSDCTFSLLRWLRAVRTMEQWAVRMMDASSKMPEGILYGTFSTFGSYDECIGIKTPKANLQMPYSGQYCSINIQPILPPKERHFTIQNAFGKYPKLQQVFKEMNIEEDTMAYYYILKHRTGICMPSTCTMEDLGNVTEKLADHLKMKISVERCETAEKPKLSRGQIISMSGVFIAFAIVILATIVDISLRVRSDHEMDIDEIIRKKNGLRQFSYVFSAYGNACKILDTSIPTTHLSSLHGIKFLSISWVMLGHVYYCKDYLTLAGLNKVRDLGSNFAFQVVLNSAFAADTFFFLSGLLVVYSTFIYLENNNGHFTIVGFYIRRYWRLTPAFLMISGVILLGPLAGSGPIWHETLQPFVSGCENYWWTNLFYFSNFMPTSKTCVPHGWFLSCDMQFYIVAPIIILALYRRPKLGILLIILGILSSVITTGCLTFLYDLPPVSLFSLPDPKDINEYLDTVGYKPYAHYTSYCVGMATGFLLAAKQKISLSKCLQIFGWIVSTVGCCLVIYGTWNWNSGELPSWPVSVAYATTSRTVWCMGVAWLTVVCYAGHGGPINSILSWHGFIPLSRLSYLAYLIHPLLMYLYASYVRSPFYFSQYVVVYLYLGHVCVTFGLAFLFSLAFEVPFLNLEKLITKYLDKSRRKRRASFTNHHNNWPHPEHPEMKDSVVLMRRRPDKFLT